MASCLEGKSFSRRDGFGVKSVSWRLAVGYGDQLLTGRWSHSPTSRFPSFPTPVVITEPVPDRTGSLRHVSKEMGSYKQWNVCLRWHPDMSHIVDSCLLRKLDGGLQRLHAADKAAVDWLTSYMSHRSIRNITLPDWHCMHFMLLKGIFLCCVGRIVSIFFWNRLHICSVWLLCSVLSQWHIWLPR